jgi:hypothetical protein
MRIESIQAGGEVLVRTSIGTFLASQIRGIWITGSTVVVDDGSAEFSQFRCADEAEAHAFRGELEAIWVKALEARA